MEWLYKISITCFAASYAIVFLLEISRIFFDVALPKFVLFALAAAELFAHTVYLVLQGKLEFDSTGIWLGSWFGWCLAASWILAAAYVWILIRQPKSVFGLFLLPVVMILIALGTYFGSENQFTANRAKTVWNMVHGSALLLGTAVVALGFVFGVVYLIQSNRLKQKIPQSKLFRLPSLEWLQRSCESSLVGSTILLAIGLISGIAINLINRRGAGDVGSVNETGFIAWTDPVIWSSGILFLWLFIVSIFNIFYRPARMGRKVAYLVVASFLFLVIELGIVWWVGHAVSDSSTPDRTKSAMAETKPGCDLTEVSR